MASSDHGHLSLEGRTSTAEATQARVQIQGQVTFPQRDIEQPATREEIAIIDVLESPQADNSMEELNLKERLSKVDDGQLSWLPSNRKRTLLCDVVRHE